MKNAGTENKVLDQPADRQDGCCAAQVPWKDNLPILAVGGAVLLAVFAWAYWPTLAEFVDKWETEPDYSHGYLVVPLALCFLWVRRDRFPGAVDTLAWPGLILVLAGIGVRIFGAYYFIPVDGWSILLWTAGIVWFFGGWRVAWWSAPSILFLWFMMPLPWSAERFFSVPLQGMSTKLSCWTLQFLGYAALTEGNTILLGDDKLQVADACSGLRIFMGILALAFAYVILVRRSWWEKGLLLVSAIPIALVANSTRVVVTALLYQAVDGKAAHQQIHDWAGRLMIPFAAGLFAIVLWYLAKLMRDVEQIDVRAVVRRD